MCCSVGLGVFFALLIAPDRPRDICRPRGHTCQNWLARSNLQLLFNSATRWFNDRDDTEGKGLSFSRFLVKKRDPEEAALMKASLCSKASAEHGTSSETSLRARLAHHVWRRVLLPAAHPTPPTPTPHPPPPRLSAELLCIGKDCSGKRPGGVDRADFMGLFIPSSLLLSGTLI